MAKGIYIGADEKLEVVDYIESTGAQYIDTEIIAKNTVNMEVVTNLNSSSVERIFGARNDSNKYECYITSNKIRFYYNSTYTDAVDTTNADEYSITLKNGVQKINDIEYATDSGEFDINLNIYLFASNVNGVADYFGTGIKIKQCKIYENETLVRDFIPVKTDTGIYCLYDKVTQNKFMNKGTGEFTGGFVNTELEYIEANGTQYIDTGVKNSTNIRVVSCMAFPSGETFYNGTEVGGTNGRFKWGHNSESRLMIGWGSNSYNYDVDTSKDSVANYHIFDLKQGSQIIKSEDGTELAKYTNTTLTKYSTTNIYLFKLWLDSSSSWETQNGTARMKYCQIYNDDTLIRDFVPFIDVNGTICLYDRVNNTYYYNNGTGTFLGKDNTIASETVVLENKAKQVKKIYIGVDNVARKIKKGYIGISGKARQFFNIEKGLNYYGTITPVSVWKQMVGKGNIGDYAIIGGGSISGTYSSSIMNGSVEAYNKSLVKSFLTSLSRARRDMGFCSTPSYVIFAGGDPYNDGSTNVDAYNSSLVRSTTSHGTKLASICGGTVGQYGVMAGGQLWNAGKSNAYAYSSSLSRSTLSNLNASVMFATSASVGNYVLIGGGSTDSSIANATNKVTAYNSSLTKSTPSTLETSKRLMGGASLNDYALFLGGDSSNGYETVVEVYNSDLVKTTPISISTGFTDRQSNVTTSNGEYVACLNKDGIIDIIDKNLVKTSYAQNKYTACISGIFIGNYLMHIMCDSTTEVNTYIIQE